MNRSARHRSLTITSLATSLALAFTLTEVDAAGHGGGGHQRIDAVARAAARTRLAISTSPPATTAQPHVPVLPVTSCVDDGGPGTLRSVVAGADSGAIIDLGALTCSTISLANGAIVVPFESLHFVGPGSAALSLDANQSYRRIIEHSGTGTLTITGLRLSGGWAGIGSPAYGGCIHSAGSVELDHAAVVFCKAVSTTAPAKGGGVYATGRLTLRHSIVSGNTTNPGTDGFGGGAFAGGGLYAYYSTISDNYSINLGSGSGYGGGAFTLGNVNIFASTISGNHAVNVGGVSVAGYATSAVINNSTISGNLASNIIGGVYSNTPLWVYNSTIAFNSAAQQSATFVTAGGLQLYAASADLESSIIANNVAGGFAFDVGLGDGSSVIGANNLIRTASNLMPPGTITDDPQLGPLQNNGGATATLALVATSPAIDHGNSVNPTTYDQRGAGFARSVHMGPDIGAFELQETADLIFRNGFEGGM
jgi:hypothetical protein